MGSDARTAQPNERPAHLTTVHGFWLDQHDVTNAEFRRFVVLSWDYERLAGEMLPPKLGARFAHLGDQRPAPRTWNVYDGGVIALQSGDVLHINAMRIGYTAATLDYPFPPAAARP